MRILLPSVYNGNIHYYHELFKNDEALVENHEHFVKQTFRNRCQIYGANGKLDLIIPIKKGAGNRKTIHETQIDNSSNWQTLHWRSIESGYRRSPYFEYYEDRFKPFYHTRFELLLDLNIALTKFVIAQFKKDIKLSPTAEFEKSPQGLIDLRNEFDPKNKTPFQHQHYTQVFENRYGFIPNLSVIDLLFNCGPEGLHYISKV
jgi:hypothetical protein